MGCGAFWLGDQAGSTALIKHNSVLKVKVESEDSTTRWLWWLRCIVTGDENWGLRSLLWKDPEFGVTGVPPSKFCCS